MRNSTDKYFIEMSEFLKRHCPMPGRWCNGEPIPKEGRKFQKKCEHTACKFYIPGKGCTHPKNPKNSNRQPNGGNK